MPFDQQELNSQQPAIESAPPSEAGGFGVEKAPAPEIARVEKGRETESGERIADGSLPSHAKIITQAPAYAPEAEDDYRKYKQIERVLEEDLGEIYNNLTPQEQKTFKIKGEETARSIFQLVFKKTKVKVKKIVKLIREWLKSIPGINKFFLEQEAKIKADRIAALADQSKKIEF